MNSEDISWRGEFDKIMPENWSDVGVSRKEIIAFIQSQLEKVIEDIPDEFGGVDKRPVYADELKAQLRKKWGLE